MNKLVHSEKTVVMIEIDDGFNTPTVTRFPASELSKTEVR
jgi:hypothetical protein